MPAMSMRFGMPNSSGTAVTWRVMKMFRPSSTAKMMRAAAMMNGVVGGTQECGKLPRLPSDDR